MRRFHQEPPHSFATHSHRDDCFCRLDLQVAGTNGLATILDGPLLGLGDELVDFLIQRIIELARDVAVLDGFLGLGLADDHSG